MPLLRRPFLYLDIIHLFVSLSLIIITSYLLINSISNKLNDCSGFYLHCSHSPDAYKRQQELSRTENLTQIEIYDWFGLNQLVIVVTLLAITLFGSISAFSHKRLSIFVAILLYLVHIIQLILIGVSDDRDFPKNVYRDEYTLAHHSILYTSNSLVSLLLKLAFIGLLLVEFTLFISYFVLLRYKTILSTEIVVKPKPVTTTKTPTVSS